MKIATVLANFSILVDRTPYFESISGILGLFCEVEASGEHVVTFKITPEAFWHGMNNTQGINFDFIALLKELAKEEIPQGVLAELEGFKNKFGTVTLVGPDCILVKSADILKQMQSSSALDPFIYEVEGNAVFVKNASMEQLQEIFQYEFNCPIKYHVSQNKTYLILDGLNKYAVVASDKKNALKSLYGRHGFINENDLRKRIKVSKEVTSEDVDTYVQHLLDNSFARPSLEIKEIPLQAIFKASQL